MRVALTTLVVAMFLAFSGASGTFAKETSHRFSGEISKVDVTGKMLIVKEKDSSKKEMTFWLDPEAKVLVGEKKETLAALKTGDRVTVTYRDSGGQHRAASIQVKHPKTAAVSTSTGKNPSHR